MAVRAFLLFATISLAIAACDGVPYETAPLGVTSIVNHTVSQTQTFRYRKRKLYTYLSKSSTGDTLANLKFHYRGDELLSFTSDSTKASYKRSFIYSTAEGAIDSTYYFEVNSGGFVDTTYLVSTRVISYGPGNQPASINLKNIDGAETSVELVWSNDNVTHLTYSMTDVDANETTADIEIEHDGQSCVFKKDGAFIYVIAPDQLYWLSKNNPIVLKTSSDTITNKYSYNRLGYPSSYDDTAGHHGVSYTELR